MIGHRLKLEQKVMLEEIVARRRPSSLRLVESLGVSPLTDEEREELRDVLLKDFSDDFLQGKDVHPRDRQVEALIDLLGHM